jgi:hypothetical protein
MILMMTSEIDIYRTAQLLVKNHGEDAPIQAAARVDEMLALGDVEGRTTWKRVLAAIDELLSTERPAGTYLS